MTVEEIKLTDDPLKNILIMAPYLNEKQQYILYGGMFAFLSNNTGEVKKNQQTARKGGG